MHNLNELLYPVKRYAVPALKGVVFLGGMYILGEWLPLLLDLGISVESFDWRLALFFFIVLVSFGFAVFLFRSRFFAHVRQWLKPLWLPAVLVWLVPFTGQMAASGLKGYYRYGFPFPASPGDLAYPYGESFSDVMLPVMVAMLCGIITAHIVTKAVKRPPVTAVRFALLLVFCLISLYATYVGTDYFKSGATWDDGEFLREVYLPYFHIIAFWLVPASIAAWRIIKEMFCSPADGATMLGTLGLALALAGSFICGVLFVSHLYISWNIPSVVMLKTTDGVRALWDLDEKQASMLELHPLHTMPPHVVNAATVFLRSREHSARQYATRLLVIREGGYTSLERGVTWLNIMIFLSEEELFSAWLATAYFGKNTYGISAAAKTYYSKPLAELSICEAAMLVPVLDDSWKNPIDRSDLAKERQQALLDDMLKLGLVSETDRESCR